MRVLSLRFALLPAAVSCAMLLVEVAPSHASVTAPPGPASIPVSVVQDAPHWFGSPFQVAPSQSFPSQAATSPQVPAAGNQCNLYGQTVANSNSTTTHKSWVSCTTATNVQVEECPYENVGGSYVKVGSCVTKPTTTQRHSRPTSRRKAPLIVTNTRTT